jgi:hypothetical protein
MSRSGTASSESQDLASACSLASDAPMTDTLAVLLMMDATARSGTVRHEGKGQAVASAPATSLRTASRRSHASTSSASHRTIEPPNKSFNRTRNGMAPGPCSRLGHHRPHAGSMSAFCLVSSDSAFTRLATRIRESVERIGSLRLCASAGRPACPFDIMASGLELGGRRTRHRSFAQRSTTATYPCRADGHALVRCAPSPARPRPPSPPRAPREARYGRSALRPFRDAFLTRANAALASRETTDSSKADRLAHEVTPTLARPTPGGQVGAGHSTR